jgi:chaperonin cofactor prefoldin
MSRPPDEPRFTCDSIDSAISYLEDLRQSNADLREWGSWWMRKAEELEEQLDEADTLYEEETTKLEEQIEELQDEIEKLKAEIAPTLPLELC